MLEHQRGNAIARHIGLEIGQVERHHFVADELVDHGIGKQYVLGAPVETPQKPRRLFRITAVELGRKAS